MMSQKSKKAILIIREGTIEGMYITDPDLELIVVDYDKDIDSEEAFDKLLDEYAQDPELQNGTPTVIHPGEND